ncbi:MAG: hypothetical protein DRP51_11515, partial [Candidatus Zixiibacteriota bacterium]
ANDKKRDDEPLEIEANANLLGDDQIDVSAECEIPTDKLPVNNVESQKPQSPSPVKPEKVEKPEPFKVDWGTPAKNAKDISSANQETPGSKDKIPSADDFSKKRSEMKPEIENNSHPIKPMAPIIPNMNNSKSNDPETSESKITKSSRVRGIAYFHKNIIQLAGMPFLRENEEITYKDKPYRLRPYQISKKAKMIGIAAMFLLLSIAIGSQIIGPALPGQGQIVGIVLDEEGQPYLGGAGIYIPELNKSVTSNALGFFRFDDVPTGSYEVIYKLGNDLEGKDNITITAGSFTMRSFGDFEMIAESFELSSNQEIETQKPATSTTESANKISTASKNKSTSKNNSSSSYGKIKLDANIENAKFVVDGKTLGAGNNTFSKIKAGKRKIQVSKPGYTEYTEIVTVSKNKTITVKANLSRKATDSNETLTANDYYDLGNDALVAEKYKSAINEFTKAIELSPNHVDAYSKRAQAYIFTGKNDKAAADYIRLGEIYSFKNQNGLAISQFTSALKYSKDNTTALVGRAGARMDKGEYRSALLDYTSAIDIDNQFYPAQFGAGVAEYKLGDNKNAEKYLKKAKKLNDSNPQLYHYLMLNYLARDNIKQMKKAYAQFKVVAGSRELADFKLKSRFAPVVRLIDEEDL